jgi:hypothetical protein
MFNNFLFGENVKDEFVQIWICKNSGTAGAQNEKGVNEAAADKTESKQEKDKLNYFLIIKIKEK